MRYRDKKTGHFVSKTTWSRSKARGGVRFVRERQAGRLGRSTPRKRIAGKSTLPKKSVGGVRFVRESVPLKRTASKKRTPKQRPGRLPKKPVVVDHIVTVKITTRERNPKTGRMRDRGFSRDIVIPAKPGASQKQLLKIAEKYLPPKERYVLDWFKQKGRKITVAEGQTTRRKRAYLR